MRRLKCTIQYDGTGYAGYQVQPNGVTIQEVIESRQDHRVGTDG